MISKSVIREFDYNGAIVEFDLQPTALMVNATEMAKIFGKQVNHFTATDNTKAFIEAFIKKQNNANSRDLNIETEEYIPVKTGIYSEAELIKSSQKGGTWMHRVLALKFAAWLSPDFEVWIYETIDEVLFGKYREMEISLRQSATRKNRLDELRLSLYANDEFAEYEKLLLEERQASYKRGKTVTNQLALFREGIL
jgi:hypothetical protein